MLNDTHLKRGLAIVWDVPTQWGNIYGAGKMLPVLYWAHELCIRLRRYCHIRLADAALSSYFGFANNQSWGLNDLHRYNTFNRSGWIQVPMPTRNHSLVDFFRETLYYKLKLEDAPLYQLKLTGWLPRHDRFPSAPTSDLDRCGAEWANPGVERAPLPPPCLCRYVTQPLKPPTRSFGAPIAMHMRTGFADSSDAVTWSVPADLRATRHWLRAACGDDPFARSGARYLLTDAPGLAIALTARYPHVHSGSGVQNYSQRAVGKTRMATRTWKAPPEVTRAVYDDVTIAGWSTVLLVAPQRTSHKYDFIKRRRAFGRLLISSFWVGIVARSMCLVRCEPLVPECPGFADTFIRDLPMLLAVKQDTGSGGAVGYSGRFKRLPAPLLKLDPIMQSRRQRAMQQQMKADHPCKNVTFPECLASYTSALKPGDEYGADTRHT